MFRECPKCHFEAIVGDTEANSLSALEPCYYCLLCGHRYKLKRSSKGVKLVELSLKEGVKRV